MAEIISNNFIEFDEITEDDGIFDTPPILPINIIIKEQVVLDTFIIEIDDDFY